MSNHTLAFILSLMAGWLVFSVLVTIATVGKPRGPVTGGTAAIVTVLYAGWITVIIITAIRLLGT